MTRQVHRSAIAAAVPLIVACLVAAGCGAEHGEGEAAQTTATETTPTDSTPPPSTATEPGPEEPPPAPPPPPSRQMSWESAGAFVWHETDVDPGLLGTTLRDNGFGWVAVYLHDGAAEDPVEADWVRRFRVASGLPVGGWGVLRAEPLREASLADELVRRYGLDFYIANAESEYGYSGPSGPDGVRYRRSQRFTGAFRTLQPTLPVGLSSYCRADMHDLDWAAWHRHGFVYLPQAYVNDFGAEVTPAACARGAGGFFPLAAVHPTIGMHPGQSSSLAAAAYAPLLERAGTTGFSVYLAETRMTPEEWHSLGTAIATLGIARQ